VEVLAVQAALVIDAGCPKDVAVANNHLKEAAHFVKIFKVLFFKPYHIHLTQLLK
jgi:hypothetical protein